jgi:serine phosphatase RsbU (regulator of sigma subunit)
VAGDQFGYEATSNLLAELCKQRPTTSELMGRLFDHVAGFRGLTPQSDDMTCIVIKAL